MEGPRNEESINGTHPAMAAETQTNGDVQVPYRFPITPETHDNEKCKKECWKLNDTKTMAETMQAAQCAQIGYTCDYCCKRAARSCNEVKECMKGHRKLHRQISEQNASYIGKRHVLRLCSDCYGKGICRSNQESINLRIGGNDKMVTSAESFHTGSCENFPGPT